MVTKCALWRMKWACSWVCEDFPVESYFPDWRSAFLVIISHLKKKKKSLYLFSISETDYRKIKYCKFQNTKYFYVLKGLDCIRRWKIKAFFFLKLNCIPQGWNFLCSEQIVIKNVLPCFNKNISDLALITVKICFLRSVPLKWAWKFTFFSLLNLTDEEWVACGQREVACLKSVVLAHSLKMNVC